MAQPAPRYWLHPAVIIHLCSEAAAAMVVPELTVQPSADLVAAYDLKYKLFMEELRARKILN